ncbi:MAG: cell wall-binding repeat-containing protein [Sporichthyaceae bacterium]|nr:cell wall-binding repeat-containing protein [Sporichthyaceae bacterium]
MVDTRDYPWNRSSLPIDPILELYSTGGTLLKRVDAQWEGGTELASVSVTGPGRILVRVMNYYANGSRTAYSVTPAFVDTVAPTLLARGPAPGAVAVSYDAATVTADFSEAVTGVSTSTVQLRNAAGAVVGAAVTYSSSNRRATLRPSAPLAAEATYQVRLTTGIKDVAANSLAATTWSFTTGKSVPRIAGSDRYATSAAISRLSYGPGVPVVYIATGTSFPDALAGGPAARVGKGPLLLTAPDSLLSATVTELMRLKPGRIVILGGTSAVSREVETALRGYTAGGVTRVAGRDRYATAAAISASAFSPGASVVYIATGSNFPDALAAGAAAARVKAPILLVGSKALPDATAAELTRLDPDQIIVMGGTSAVSTDVFERLKGYAASVRRMSGADRYATAVNLSASTFAANGVKTVYLATGSSFPDGLSAGPVAGTRGGPLLLVPSSFLPDSVASELRRLDPSQVVIVGGTSAVSESVRNQVRALWP